MSERSDHVARALPPAVRLLILARRASPLLRALEEQGIDCTHQQATEWSDFRLAAVRGSFDVILAEYDRLDVPLALRSLRASAVQTPLILITGRLTQEQAIAAIKAGAHECVRRNDLGRLGEVIEAALARPAAAGEPLRATFPDARYRDVVEDLNDVVFAIDANGHITFISKAIEEVSGFKREELLGRSYLSLVHPDDLADLLASLDRSVRGEILPAEWRALDKDGRVHWVRSFSRAVFASGQLAEIRGVLTDITERRRVEEELRRTLEEKAALYRARSEEAEIGAALAALARELITSLDTPHVLDRLCSATSSALGCDYTHTFLLEDDAYTPVAGHGDPAEMWQSMRLIHVPRHRLERAEWNSMSGIAVLEGIRGQSISPWLPRHDVGAGLFVPLRRGSELIGCLTAAVRADSFDAKAPRIAQGIAHLASLALQNARLIEEFERADHSRADFVANLSHELRTPLNVIIGYSDLLLDDAFGAVVAEQRDAVRRIGEQARELIDLVNTTLDLSRIEAGRVPLDVEEVDLREVLDEIECETEVTFGDRAAVSFSWSVADDLPRLATDAVKLKVVIKNLVTNAMKFTVRGTVAVRGERRDDGVEISVVDTGPGIARDQQAAIFEAFRQIDVGTGAQKGVGLGLHIVQRLLVVLGGTIRVESEPGRGATFIVWLPQRAPRSGAPRLP